MSVVPFITTGEVEIFGRKVGNGSPQPDGGRNPCLIIAEIGINHDGDFKKALEMIAIAANCGVDVVKFQKRDLNALYGKANVEYPNNSSAFGLAHYMPILKRVELDKKDFERLKERATAIGVDFLVTPWDEPSVDFCEELGVDAYKIASADCVNPFMHRKISATGKPVIVSTGMHDEGDLLNYMQDMKVCHPGRLILMHSVSSYPTADEDCQLHNILKYKINHQIPVGWSGHERAVSNSVCAVAMGADVIERHFTLDRTSKGPDHAASLEADGLGKLVARIRSFEKAYGNPYQSRISNRGELATREVLGKSLYFRVDIPAGIPIRWEMLEARSPGTGVPPKKANGIIGKILHNPVKAGDIYHDKIEFVSEPRVSECL